jgi:hypothetical protein
MFESTLDIGKRMAADDQSEEREGAGNEAWHEIERLVGARRPVRRCMK